MIPRTVAAGVAEADIEVHLPGNVAARLLSIASPYYPQTMSFVYDKAPVSAGDRIPVTIETTFVRTANGPDLPARLTVHGAAAATVNGRVHRVLHTDVSLLPPVLSVPEAEPRR